MSTLVLQCAVVLLGCAGLLTLAVVASNVRTGAARSAPARAAADRVEAGLHPDRRAAVRRMVRRGGRPYRASEEVLAVQVALGLQSRRRSTVPLVLVAAGLAAGALALRSFPVLAVAPTLAAAFLVLVVVAVQLAARRSRPLLAPYPAFAAHRGVPPRRASSGAPGSS